MLPRAQVPTLSRKARVSQAELRGGEGGRGKGRGQIWRPIIPAEIPEKNPPLGVPHYNSTIPHPRISYFEGSPHQEGPLHRGGISTKKTAVEDPSKEEIGHLRNKEAAPKIKRTLKAMGGANRTHKKGCSNKALKKLGNISGKRCLCVEKTRMTETS